jgi:hypothetical protein
MEWVFSLRKPASPEQGCLRWQHSIKWWHDLLSLIPNHNLLSSPLIDINEYYEYRM